MLASVSAAALTAIALTFFLCWFCKKGRRNLQMQKQEDEKDAAPVEEPKEKEEKPDAPDNPIAIPSRPKPAPIPVEPAAPEAPVSIAEPPRQQWEVPIEPV